MSDLVVVGSGAAGLTGALVAALSGAQVTVLEKAALVGGTTAISGGGAWIPCNPHMSEVGVADSREDALEYLRACSGDSGDDAILTALVDHGPAMIRMLEEQAGVRFQVWPASGGATDYRPWLPGARPGGRTLEVEGFSMRELGAWAERIRTDPALCSETNLLEYYRRRMHLQRPGSRVLRRPAPGAAKGDMYWRGTALVATLLHACLAHGVTVELDTPATELLLEDGHVAGVRAVRDREPVEVRAPHVSSSSSVAYWAFSSDVPATTGP